MENTARRSLISVDGPLADDRDLQRRSLRLGHTASGTDAEIVHDQPSKFILDAEAMASV